MSLSPLSLLQPVSIEWGLRILPLQLLDPVPSDIVVARSQVPKPITELAEEIGLKPSEVHNAFLVGRA